MLSKRQAFARSRAAKHLHSRIVAQRKDTLLRSHTQWPAASFRMTKMSDQIRVQKRTLI